METTTLQAAWADYSKHCYPGGMTREQEAHLYNAWFAACFYMLTSVIRDVSEMPDDDAVKTLKRLQDEAYAVCRDRATAVKSHN